jgi:transposase
MSQQASLDWWTTQVLSERRDTPSDPVRLVLAPTATVALCPHCSRPSDSIHRRTDSDPSRDLPHGPQAVELVLRTPQFHCERSWGA